MKPRELLYLAGFKPKARTYGFEVRETDLGPDGPVRYAQWLHPKAYPCAPSATEVAELRTIIRPGDFCVDVGAHSGDSTLPLALAAGPEGAVLAMEPNRYLFPVLEENARLVKGRGVILPVMAAATPTPGTYTFGYSEPGYCNGGDPSDLAWWRRGRLFPLEVTGVNLESLLREQKADRLDKLRLIKTDTEGNDRALLESISGLIEEFRPYLQVEVYKYSPPDDRKRLHAMLTDWGYRVNATDSPESMLGAPATADDICALPHCDLFCFPSDAAQRAA